MQSMYCSELEVEIGKMARAMKTRNSKIGKDLSSHFRTQFTTEAIACLMIVTIERLIWFDTDSVSWTIEYLIPANVIRRLEASQQSVSTSS